MSFDVNSVNSKPVIREAANMQNDGGAGNLGYFEREERKKKQEEQSESIFGKDEKGDTFGHEDDIEEEIETFSFSKLVAQVIFFFKNLFNPSHK